MLRPTRPDFPDIDLSHSIASDPSCQSSSIRRFASVAEAIAAAVATHSFMIQRHEAAQRYMATVS